MKVQAFILLIPVLAYFAELVQIPRNIPEPNIKTACCAKMDPTQIPCKKQRSGKETSNNCGGMTCLNCPLGYNSMIQPAISITSPFCSAANNYFPIDEELVSDYFNKSWKPPKTT